MLKWKVGLIAHLRSWMRVVQRDMVGSIAKFIDWLGSLSLEKFFVPFLLVFFGVSNPYFLLNLYDVTSHHLCKVTRCIYL